MNKGPGKSFKETGTYGCEPISDRQYPAFGHHSGLRGDACSSYINRRRFAELDNASATDLINHKGAQIIDLRDPSDFKKECIARSVNIPADRIHYELDKLDKTKPILLVDEDGKRARMASPLLRGVGCKQVYILQGGLNAWRRSGTPFSR